ILLIARNVHTLVQDYVSCLLKRTCRIPFGRRQQKCCRRALTLNRPTPFASVFPAIGDYPSVHASACSTRVTSQQEMKSWQRTVQRTCLSNSLSLIRVEMFPAWSLV